MKNRRNFFDRFVKAERTGPVLLSVRRKSGKLEPSSAVFLGVRLWNLFCLPLAVLPPQSPSPRVFMLPLPRAGRGLSFPNSYWFSVLKRENANKKAEYRLVTVVFSCLSAIFLLLTVEIFTQWPWTAALRWALIAFVLIYALADAFRTVLKGSKT